VFQGRLDLDPGFGAERRPKSEAKPMGQLMADLDLGFLGTIASPWGIPTGNSVSVTFLISFLIRTSIAAAITIRVPLR